MKTVVLLKNLCLVDGYDVIFQSSPRLEGHLSISRKRSIKKVKIEAIGDQICDIYRKNQVNMNLCESVTSFFTRTLYLYLVNQARRHWIY